MTFRIKMLTAAAVLAIPAVAGAQLVPTPPPEATTQQPDTAAEAASEAQQASESAQGTADETVRQAEEVPNQPVQSQVTTAQPAPQPTPEPMMQPAPTPAEAPPGPAQTQMETTAQTETSVQTTVQAGPVSAATATDMRAGVMVHDASGGMVGTVVSADADSAVVSTGAIQAEIPLRSFGKNNVGLVISMTRAQLETAARAQSPG